MSTRSCFQHASTDLDRKGRDWVPGRRVPFFNPLCGVARSVRRSYHVTTLWYHTNTHTHTNEFAHLKLKRAACAEGFVKPGLSWLGHGVEPMVKTQ